MRDRASERRRSFQSRMAEHGPGAPGAADSRAARRHCRRLAQRHYENFSVASLLIPASLRQDFYNVYAFCRWADDLADEADTPLQASRWLEWWRGELRRMYAGGPSRHPVFVALSESLERHAFPLRLLERLIEAFEQDQSQTRYATFEELRDYCRGSAAPVGRLVLQMAGCHDARRGALADEICTGLQLANFCQDVGEDWDRGRIYLPQESCRRFGYGEPQFRERLYNEAFVELLRFETRRARDFLERGAPLMGDPEAPAWLRRQLRLFVGGGRAILDAIRLRRFDVWRGRPTVGRGAKLRLLLRACLTRSPSLA